MRRANYLAALKISNKNGDDKLFSLIVKTFLTEDLTGAPEKGRNYRKFGRTALD
jgi:hypothetical protein